MKREKGNSSIVFSTKQGFVDLTKLDQISLNFFGTTFRRVKMNFNANGWYPQNKTYGTADNRGRSNSVIYFLLFFSSIEREEIIIEHYFEQIEFSALLNKHFSTNHRKVNSFHWKAKIVSAITCEVVHVVWSKSDCAIALCSFNYYKLNHSQWSMAI